VACGLGGWLSSVAAVDGGVASASGLDVGVVRWFVPESPDESDESEESDESDFEGTVDEVGVEYGRMPLSLMGLPPKLVGMG